VKEGKEKGGRKEARHHKTRAEEMSFRNSCGQRGQLQGGGGGCKGRYLLRYTVKGEGGRERTRLAGKQ